MKDLKTLLRQYALLMVLVLPLLVMATGCSDDDDGPTDPPATLPEAELLIAELEGNMGDYLNTKAPAIVKADAVYEDINGPQNFYIIDIRSASDFASGHIDGAKNVIATDVLSHVEGLAKDKKIVMVCYSGQTAAFVTAILRMSGYTEVASMKYGMSSWNPAFDRISAKCSSQYSGVFSPTPHPKAAAGAFPTLTTGKSTGAAILADRIATVNTAGFGAHTIGASTVIENPNDYYIVNYWSEAHYTGIGHIPGAMQYTPKADLMSTTFLNTLPTDKPVVVYCYTGQTSANVAAILSVMGYEAKSLVYGTQGMIWDDVTAAGATAFDASKDTHTYEYVK